MGVDPFAALGIDQAPPVTMGTPPGGGDAIPMMRVTPGKKGGLDPFAALGIESPDQHPPMTVAPPHSAGLSANFAAGANRSIASALGAPVDLATWGMNLPGRAINAVAGTNIAPIEHPVGGSEWLQRQWENLTGVNPANVQPTTEAERMAAGAGGAIAQVPVMALGGAGAARLGGGGIADALAASGGQTGPQAAQIAAATGAGGATGQLAEDKAPDWAKPYANLAGNIGGAGAALLGMEGLRAGYNAATSAAGRMGIGPKTEVAPGVRATESQAIAAGQRASDILGPEGQQQLAQFGQAERQARDLEATIASPETTPANRMMAQKQLQAIASRREQLVPGAQPTVAQLVPNEKTVAYERDMRTLNNPAFATRDTANTQAMQTAMQSAAPGTTGPEAVSNLLRAHLDAIDQLGHGTVAAARQGVERATEGLGGTASPDAIGAGVREPLIARNAAAKVRERALWRAIDPDDKLALPLGDVQGTARGLLDEMNPNLGDAAAGPEMQILSGAAGLPSVVPFRHAQRLRSNIGNVERALRSSPGNDQSLRRLGMLKSSLDDAIANAAEGAAARDPDLTQRIANIAQREGYGSQIGREAGSGAASGAAGEARGVSGDSGGARPSEAGSRNAPGDSAVAVAGANGRPDSLVDFLIRRGGIQDQGGDLRANDLQTVHHRAGGRLVNPRGMTLDHAREAAAEAGFIRPNADINEFLDAVTSRQPTYRISETADASNLATQTRQASREQHDRFMAGANVQEAASQLGVRLTPREETYAAEQHLHGADPHEAVRTAVRIGDDEVLQRNAEHNAVGSPGVPLAARQAEMPVSGGIEPNFDAEAAGRYANARQATLERKQTYGTGAVGRAVQEGQQGAEFRVEPAAVPRQFLTNNAVEPARVQKYIEAVGGAPQAVANMRDALVSDLRAKGGVQPDGQVKTSTFDRWLQQRGRTIDLFPGLRDELGTVRQAQQLLDDTAAAHVGAVKDFQNGVAKDFLKAEPQVATARIFTSGNSTQTARELYGLVKDNPDALAGLRRGVVDFLDQKFNFDPSASDAIKSKAFRDFMGQHRNAFKIVFGGQGAQNIDMVEAMLNRIGRAQQKEATLGSNTAQKAWGAVGHGAAEGGKTALFVIVGEELMHNAASLLGHGGAVQAGMRIAGLGAGFYLNSLRRAGIRTMNDLGREMMLNPELTRALMQKVPTESAFGPTVQRRVGAALQSAILANGAATTERKTQ